MYMYICNLQKNLPITPYVDEKNQQIGNITKSV